MCLITNKSDIKIRKLRKALKGGGKAKAETVISAPMLSKATSGTIASTVGGAANVYCDTIGEKSLPL